MRYILGFAALAAMSGAPMLIGCAGEAVSGGDASETGEANVGEAANAFHGTVIGAPGTSSFVNLRTGPGTSYQLAGVMLPGAGVEIVCQTFGEAVSGPSGLSALWDKLDNGLYIADTFVFTGSNGPVAPLCPGGGGGG